MRNKSSNKRPRSSSLYVLQKREPKSQVINYGTAPGVVGALTHVTAIAQGDGLADRSGDKINVEKVVFRVNIISTATNNTRYILFRDKMNFNITPTRADVLASASVSSALSSLNFIQQGRYKILMDKTVSSSVNGDLAHYICYTSKVNAPCFYYGAAANQFANGSIWLLVISDAAAASGHDVNIQTIYSDF